MIKGSDIKRQILMEAEKTGIRKAIVNQAVTSQDEDEKIEMGVALEEIVGRKGWAYIDAYLVNHIMKVVTNDEVSEAERQTAKAYRWLMQYIDQAIRAKDDIEARRRAAREGDQ